MAKSKEEKTNVMRTLEQKKIPYTAHSYDPEGPIDGVSVAQTLGQPPEQVFKTLVTKGASGAYYVFDIPVAENLDLKKGGQGRWGEVRGHAAPEGTAAPDGLRPRRLLPGGHEEAVPPRCSTRRRCCTARCASPPERSVIRWSATPTRLSPSCGRRPRM